MSLLCPTLALKCSPYDLALPVIGRLVARLADHQLGVRACVLVHPDPVQGEQRCLHGQTIVARLVHAGPAVGKGPVSNPPLTVITSVPPIATKESPPAGVPPLTVSTSVPHTVTKESPPAGVSRGGGHSPVDEAADAVRRGGGGVSGPHSGVGAQAQVQEAAACSRLTVAQQVVDEGDFGGVVNPEHLEVVGLAEVVKAVAVVCRLLVGEAVAGLEAPREVVQATLVGHVHLGTRTNRWARVLTREYVPGHWGSCGSTPCGMPNCGAAGCVTGSSEGWGGGTKDRPAEVGGCTTTAG
ncbi:hypothetical protein E2C01_017279 [Portunus trituberculatus]|uniref:Uncharacterized protein n=1 Tax=Portunus trituberculatus TaxID=210409 RepID=A0A5B7DR78_PORTR|nr:hypothetical protein [Portunus trituberculatus]